MSASTTPGSPVPVLNIANALTVFRIVLVPVMIWFLLADQGTYGLWRWLALLTFVVAIATDKIDGDIARSRGLITNFGKIADPIADKLLIGAALILLSILGDLPVWITVVILVREVGITLLRFVVIRYGVIAASPGGKAKTVTQALAIFLYLLPVTFVLGGWAIWVAFAVMMVAVVLTVITGIDYLVRAWNLVRRGSETR